MFVASNIILLCPKSKVDNSPPRRSFRDSLCKGSRQYKQSKSASSTQTETQKNALQTGLPRWLYTRRRPMGHTNLPMRYRCATVTPQGQLTRFQVSGHKAQVTQRAERAFRVPPMVCKMLASTATICIFFAASVEFRRTYLSDDSKRLSSIRLRRSTITLVVLMNLQYPSSPLDTVNTFKFVYLISLGTLFHLNMFIFLCLHVTYGQQTALIYDPIIERMRLGCMSWVTLPQFLSVTPSSEIEVYVENTCRSSCTQNIK